MQLSHQSDYGLRVLIHLAVHRKTLVPCGAIADAYGISGSHLAKIASRLAALGWIESTRGASGGLRLARAPSTYRIGAVVRELEPTLDLVECFATETNTCPIAGACRLKRALQAAREAFFESLDGLTLADLTQNARALRRALPLLTS